MASRQSADKLKPLPPDPDRHQHSAIPRSAVRLHDVADRLQISPAEVLDHYRDLDSVADAWFLRGLKAMVAPKPADFPQQPEWRRIEICLLAWFDALAPHQRVTAQMLRGKMHLPHP